MTPFEQELENNHKTFLADWTKQAQENWTKLSGKAPLAKSYQRLSCLNAIQHILVLPRFSRASAAFFLEAQNDALVSHVSANLGSWRTALQALRSCLENVLCAIYYSEHPVELELWTRGEFRIWFSDLHRYMLRHPALSKLGPAVTGLEMLKSEYEVLSKAVHASAADFRMTDGASKVLLWSPDDPRLGAWSTRERHVIEAICSLLVCLFVSELQGAKNPQLRAILWFAVGSQKRSVLKSKLGVIISPP
jgi:hypothetical protein